MMKNHRIIASFYMLESKRIANFCLVEKVMKTAISIFPCQHEINIASRNYCCEKLSNVNRIMMPCFFHFLKVEIINYH